MIRNVIILTWSSVAILAQVKPIPEASLEVAAFSGRLKPSLALQLGVPRPPTFSFLRLQFPIHNFFYNQVDFELATSLAHWRASCTTSPHGDSCRGHEQ